MSEITLEALEVLDAIDASEEIIATLTAQKQAGERSRLDKASEFEEERRV